MVTGPAFDGLESGAVRTSPCIRCAFQMQVIPSTLRVARTRHIPSRSRSTPHRPDRTAREGCRIQSKRLFTRTTERQERYADVMSFPGTRERLTASHSHVVGVDRAVDLHGQRRHGSDWNRRGALEETSTAADFHDLDREVAIQDADEIGCEDPIALSAPLSSA
jgi:hypothetical protein